MQNVQFTIKIFITTLLICFGLKFKSKRSASVTSEHNFGLNEIRRAHINTFKCNNNIIIRFYLRSILYEFSESSHFSESLSFTKPLWILYFDTRGILLVSRRGILWLKYWLIFLTVKEIICRKTGLRWQVCMFRKFIIINLLSFWVNFGQTEQTSATYPKHIYYNKSKKKNEIQWNVLIVIVYLSKQKNLLLSKMFHDFANILRKSINHISHYG